MPLIGTQLGTPMAAQFAAPLDEKNKRTTAQRLALTFVQRHLGMTVFDSTLGYKKTLIVNPGGDTTTETDWIDDKRIQQKNDTDIIIPANGEILIDKRYDYRRMSISGGDMVINGISIVPNIPVYGSFGFRYNIETPAKLVGDLNADVQYLFCPAGVTITHNWDPSDPVLPDLERNSVRPIMTSTGKDMPLANDTIVVCRYDSFSMVWYVVGAAVSAATPSILVTYQINITAPLEEGRILLIFPGGVSSIDWGDGTAIASLATNVQKVHPYALAGVYNVTVYCSDLVTTFNVSDSLIIGSITNLDSLTNLSALLCHNNQITVLDVSSLVKLTILYCYNNGITVLNVASLTLLTELYCHTNTITTLDVTLLTALTILQCYDNPNIAVLNVSGLTLLTDLRCYNNDISILDVSGLTLLTQLQCQNNTISILDVTLSTALVILNCQLNTISVLNVTNLTSLIQLRCNDNTISVLNVTSLTSLTLLNCHVNTITVLNVTSLTLLTQIYCYENTITTLDVAALTSLTILQCYDNLISTLNVSLLTLLTELGCSNNNNINTLDVQNMNLLTTLTCGNNNITVLNITLLTVLVTLYCNDNIINDLDVRSAVIEDFLWYNNVMDGTQVDTTWNTLNANTLFVGGISNGGGTNASPSPASATARTNLAKTGGAPPSDWTLTI